MVVNDWESLGTAGVDFYYVQLVALLILFYLCCTSFIEFVGFIGLFIDI